MWEGGCTGTPVGGSTLKKKVKSQVDNSNQYILVKFMEYTYVY